MFISGFQNLNRAWLSWLIAAKGLDWFIKNSPGHVRDWKMFIWPSELSQKLQELRLEVNQITGIHPAIFSRTFASLLGTRRVSENFRFNIGGGWKIGYLAAASKAR